MDEPPRTVRTAAQTAAQAATPTPTPTPTPPPWPLSPRHLRWLLPLGLAALAVLVFALVVSIHESDKLRSLSTIETTGFTRPTSTTPVAFSLPVLQAAATAPSEKGPSEKGPSEKGPSEKGPVSMASLRGEPVVLNMWSSSCSVCKQETPAVESVARRASHAVAFVGVDTADQRGTALRFLHRYHVTYLQLFDPDEQVASGYGILGLPVTVFVSARGDVVGEYLGALDAKTLTHYLGTLFGVPAPS